MFFVSGKIPALHRVPCGCGLGERHSNAFVTQEGGNCKSFLHNCAFVPLPGGYRASQAVNKTLTTWKWGAGRRATAQPNGWKGYFIRDFKIPSASAKQELNESAKET